MTNNSKILAYVYERPTSEGDAMGCDDVYADYANTDRAELHCLMNKGGLVAGDTLRVRSIGDLGKGQGGLRIKRQIEAMGVTVEEMPAKNAPRLRGRKSKTEFGTIADHDHACSIWYSPADPKHAIKRIGAIAGGEVDENWVKYRCGSRDGSQQREKRKVALKRFGDE